MIIKWLNVLSVKTRFNHTGNHVTMESGQPVICVEQTGRSLDSNMMKTQISNEELYDIVFAVSALALEDD